MIDWSTCTAVESDPSRLSGALVFKGTRVPVSALFENLESSTSPEDIVEWFPGTTLAQVNQVLKHAAQNATAAEPKIYVRAETVVHKLKNMLASAKKTKPHS